MTTVTREHSPGSDELLRELGPALEAFRAPIAPDALVERTLLRARAELGRGLAPQRVPTPLAAGYPSELARLVAAVLPALALAVAWNLAVLVVVRALLSAWLPPAVVRTLVAAYLVGAAGWLALAVGSLPLFAHRRALGRLKRSGG